MQCWMYESGMTRELENIWSNKKSSIDNQQNITKVTLHIAFTSKKLGLFRTYIDIVQQHCSLKQIHLDQKLVHIRISL